MNENTNHVIQIKTENEYVEATVKTEDGDEARVNLSTHSKNLDQMELARSLMKFKKTSEMSMVDYVREFESRYHLLIKKNFPELPDIFLTFQITDNADLQPRDYMSVMSEIDLEKDNSLDTAKKVLIKLSNEEEVEDMDQSITEEASAEDSNFKAVEDQADDDQEQSCVKKLRLVVSIVIEKNQSQNIKSEAALHLNSRLHRYFER